MHIILNVFLFFVITAVASVCMLCSDAYAAADAHGEPFEVVFINPGKSDPTDPTGGFWQEVSMFMQAAADNLGVSLEVLYAERDHFLMRRLADEVLSRDHKPDYLILVNEKLAAGKIIAAADSKGVKVFSLLVGFYGKQSEEMGEPRVKYRNWIGGLVPDNFWAGKTLGSHLIRSALASGVPEKQIKLLPIAGDYATQAMLERLEGLKEVKEMFPDITVLPQTYCFWRKDLAQQSAAKFLQRDPSINIVWAGNDPMALGAIEASIEVENSSLNGFWAGGINWDEPALMAIQSGEQAVSVGGHFMAGGWGLVMLYDYHHGIDFSRPDGAMLKMRIFAVLDKNNIGQFLAKFGDRDWSRIDFRKFSRAYNRSLAEYNFCLKSLLYN